MKMIERQKSDEKVVKKLYIRYNRRQNQPRMTSIMRSLARSLHHDYDHHHSPHLHHDHDDQDHQHHHDGQPAGDDLKFDLEKSGEQSPMNRVIEHLPHLPNIITSSSSSSRFSSRSSSPSRFSSRSSSTSSKRFLLPLRN